jgi:hypothetical protein
MGKWHRGKRDPHAPTDALLTVADRLAALPTEELMNDLGLTRDKAEGWQRICAELAANVRSERKATRSVGRRFRPWRGPELANGTGGTDHGVR